MNWKELLKLSVQVSLPLFILWMASNYLAFTDHGYRESLTMALLSAPLITAFLLVRKKNTDREVVLGVIISFLFTMLLWVPFALFGF